MKYQKLKAMNKGKYFKRIEIVFTFPLLSTIYNMIFRLKAISYMKKFDIVYGDIFKSQGVRKYS